MAIYYHEASEVEFLRLQGLFERDSMPETVFERDGSRVTYPRGSKVLVLMQSRGKKIAVIRTPWWKSAKISGAAFEIARVCADCFSEIRRCACQR